MFIPVLLLYRNLLSLRDKDIHSLLSLRDKDIYRVWDTPEWLRKSASGKSNRASADSVGKVSRHTGGSMGYDEHRIRLGKKLGRTPTFLELYCETHLNKEDKAKFWAGECRTIENLEGLTFCTSTTKERFMAYARMTCQTQSFGPENADYEQSQQVLELQQKQAQMEAQMAEQEEKMRAEMEQQSQRETELAKRQSQLEAQMAAFMLQHRNNNPSNTS